MTETQPRHKPLHIGVAVGLAAVALIVISLFFAAGPWDPSQQAHIVWPERLSASVAGSLVVTVSEDDSNASPIPGAQVTLYQLHRSSPRDHEPLGAIIHRGDPAQLRPLGDATTDPTGVAQLTLPPVARSEAGAAHPNGAISCQPSTDSTRCPLDLVIHIQSDEGELFQHHRFEPPQEAALAITTDRPLYQPGQTLLARSLMVDPDLGTPTSGDVTWSVRDPQNNLVFTQTVPASDAGVAQVRMPLAERGLQGTWRLSATSGLRTATATFEVRPFRLPRFKVTVAPKTPTVAPGQPIEVTVTGRTTYGDPVRGAATEINLAVTRQGGSRAEENLTATLNDDGEATVSWTVPRDAAAGATVQLAAVVTTEAGRAERGAGAAQVQSAPLTVSLLSEQGTRWSNGVLNTGYLIVRDDRSRPVEGASFSLWAPEQGGERRIDGETDAHGHASFTWTPWSSGSRTIRVKVTAPDGRAVSRNIQLPIHYERVIARVTSASVSVGEPFEVKVDNLSRDATLVAFNRSYPVGAASLSRVKDRVTMTLGAVARGLTNIVVIDNRGQRVASTRVWVRQRGGDDVTLRPDAPSYKPGGLARIDLAFPPTSGAEGSEEPPLAPVTFGLIGVDEALYALMERLDAPLTLLLRHEPGDVAALQSALGALSEETPDDALAQTIAQARFTASLGATGNSRGSYGSDVTREVHRAARRPWLIAWMMFLSLLILAATGVAGWSFWTARDREALSWRSALALLGVGLAALTAGAVMMIGGSPEFFAGGLTVWGGVVVCWLIAAALARRDLPLGRWLIAVVTTLFVVGCVAVSATDDSRNIEGWPLGVTLVAAGIAALVLVAGVVSWGLLLLHAKMRKPALGLGTLLGVPLALLTSSVLLVSGGADMAKQANFAMEEARMDDAMPSSAPMLKKKSMNAPTDAPDADEPSGGGGPRVRNYFPETMLWMPEVRSNVDGRAQVEVEIPDSITTWRVEATASAWDGRMGYARTGVPVIKPFFAELELPTQLTQGDLVEVPITLVNNSDAPIQTTLTATAADGLALSRAPAETLDVPAKARRQAVALVLAQVPGRGTLTVTARVEGREGDAVQRAATIAPDGRQLRRSSSGIVGQGWRASLAVPQSALEGSTSGEVKVYPGVVADALEGLDSMLRGPTGCFEQTSSAHFPNVMVLRALKQTSPADWPGGEEKWKEAHDNAQELVTLGIQRILSFQHGGGGFSLYPARSPRVMLTAYGLMQLAATREVTTIDDNMLARAAQWLVSQQNSNGTWPAYASRLTGGSSGGGDDVAQLRATAFALWGLALAPEAAQRYQPAIERAVAHIIAHSGDVSSPNALATAANALIAAGRPKEAQALLSRLATSARREGDVAWWSSKHPTWLGGYGRYADIETTALVIHAMLSAEGTGADSGDLLQRGLRYIARARSPWGGWGSTQATAWSLRALERLRALDSGEPVTLTITHGGRPMTRRAGPLGPLQLKPGDVQRYAWDVEPVQAGAAEFNITSTGSTSAMALASVSYAVPWSDPEATDAEARLKLEIEASNRAPRRGQAISVNVTLTNTTRDHHGATIVELPLPPGAWIERDDLEDWKRQGRIDRFEVLPTHARLYLAELDAGAQRAFTYQLTPLVRGRFSLPPARAYVFYTPDPVTEIDGGELQVGEP